MRHTLLKPLLFSLSTTALLSGCLNLGPSEGIKEMRSTVAQPNSSGWNKVSAENIQEGLQALKDEDFQKASAHFNRAIKFDPQNSYAHFLNGLAYHLLGLSGDPAQLAYAETGYKVSLKLNPGNLLASQQLGRLYIEMRRFHDAQEQFASGLISAQNNLDILLGLAASSYLAQDIDTGLSAINIALKNTPENLAALKLGIILNSAASNQAIALNLLTQFKKLSPNDPWAARLSERIGEWGKFHTLYDKELLDDFALTEETEKALENVKKKAEKGKKSAVVNSSSSTSASSSSSSWGSSSGSDSSSSIDPFGTVDNPLSGTSPTTEEAPANPKMIVIDAIIIRTEEVTQYARGMNVLDGLQLNSGAFSWSFGRYQSAPSGATVRSISSAAISIPQVTYSLNIANDRFSRTEIVSKPSLLALDGQSAKFFSGSELLIALSGANAGTVEDKEVGVSLIVTPTFTGDNTLLLNVTAERAQFSARDTAISESVGDSNQLAFQITKNAVTTSAIMKLGQTLILSGLTEKTREGSKSSTPLLEQIPGASWFFSRDADNHYERSTIILLTPRAAESVYNNGNEFVEDLTQKDEQKIVDHHFVFLLKKHYPNLFPDAPIGLGLENPKFSREFRITDIDLKHWETTQALNALIEKVKNFL